MSVPTTRIAPWEDFVLRLIAVWKLSHAVFFTGVGISLLKLRGHNVANFITDAVDYLQDHSLLPYNLNPEGPAIKWLLNEADLLTSHKLLLLGYAAFFYAALFFAEGIGLYLRKHWAEYLVVVVTASLLPLEIYELLLGVAWWKVVAVIGNLGIVSYLIHRILLDIRTKAARRRAQQELEASMRPPAATSAHAKPLVNEVP